MQIRFSSGTPPPFAVRAHGDGPLAAWAPGRRVAIVEDELMVAWLLEEIVEDLGHSVVGIFATAEAMLVGIADSAEVVLMDINLGGGIDGVEAARRLGAARPPHIVFISAYDDPVVRERIAGAAPGAPLLKKPVQVDVLKAAIEALFRTSD